MASTPAVKLTGGGKIDGRFGTAIAALGDINLDHYNGALHFCIYTELVSIIVESRAQV